MQLLTKNHELRAKNLPFAAVTSMLIPKTAVMCSDVITLETGPETAIAPFLIINAWVVPKGIS